LSDEEVRLKSLDDFAAVDDGFGKYGDLFLTRSTDKTVLAKSQDGGTVSSLLMYALEKKVIDAAVVSTVSEDEPLRPVARLVQTADEVLSCAGSRYTYAPNLLALKDALERNIEKLAVVGVPCQVNGVRYLQYSTPDLEYAKWFKKHVVFVVGLFCSEVFTYSGLVKYLRDVGVEPRDVKKINIKGKVIITLKNGEDIIKPLKPLHQYERPACRFCRDYSAELADISVGALATHGWTITVVRSFAGRNIIDDAVKSGFLEFRQLSTEDESVKLLKKLCVKKRERVTPLIFENNV
ncbi:MAG: Coenzyme F420 hydrogenase/dehydrogenase, beta subunit C-terminal domain, partial [Candidatus Caldarchaeum sp.]|nr:Coenzyme F420 hydrogenase/dehydrogenase, beta subunit C-terminal domain [Candidatus Caldarchaeum sp.]MDW8436185.1 Coenzyme F420 hydrogenase/dehydrogenase, beta subunit C-terminal domain [Candidatus Caldarchaeum sp.]